MTMMEEDQECLMKKLEEKVECLMKKRVFKDGLSNEEAIRDGKENEVGLLSILEWHLIFTNKKKKEKQLYTTCL